MSSYEFLTRSELVAAYRDAQKSLIESRAAASATPTDAQSKLIAEYSKEVEELKQALGSSTPTSQPQSSNGVDYKYVQIANSMISAMKDVKKLQPGVQVEGFINTLKNNYDLLVKPDLTTFPRLETEFIKQARLRLAESYNTQLTNSKEDVSTFDKFIEYLTKVHGSQLGSFQLLSRAWNLELGENECYADYATKLELRLRDAAQQIKSRFTKEKRTASNDRPELSADEVFQLMGAMLIAEKVKENSPKIFSMMIKTMDRHWTASNIAHEAKLYQERLGEESESILVSDESAFYSRRPRGKGNTEKPTQSNQRKANSGTKSTISSTKTPKTSVKKKDRTCWNFLSGTPCRHTPCRFEHTKPHTANMAIVATNPEMAENDTESADFRHGLLC